MDPNSITSSPTSWFFVFRPSREDLGAGFNYMCAVLGIGSLAMGRNFGRAGLLPASLALALMFLMNVFASTALSVAMLRAPADVTTFAELGQFACGKYGKMLVLVSQMGTCVLLPIAFLVLGGVTLLPTIFEEGSPNVYMALMALTCLPVVLIRTLKEAAWAAVIGMLLCVDHDDVVDSE